MTAESPAQYKAEEQSANDWVQRLLGFAAQCENEGLLGLAQATVEQTTSITFQVASVVTSTACHIVTEAGRAMMQQNCAVEEDSSYLTLKHTPQDVGIESMEEKETPFLFKIAFQFTDIMLATFSPVLSNNNKSMHSTYSNRTDTRLIEDFDMFSTASCSMNDDEFHDAHSHACDESIACSVYFDAPDSDVVLSKIDDDLDVSTCPESDNTNDTGSFDKSDMEESQACFIESIPDMLLYTATATYYLDMPDVLLSKIDEDIDMSLMKCDNSNVECFAFNNTNEDSLQSVLDALIQESLELLSDNNVSIKWQPDDTTKKLLQQNATTSYDDGQWMQILEEQVLKWTTQVGNTPMLKTRGIINMTPDQLKNLLLDCTRVREYNKCSLGKKDLCTFYPFRGGEAKIVEHVMQIPIVGGKIETLSLTHSRPLPDDSTGFIIVSRSVKKELNDIVSNPCISISSIRSIAGTDKTELTTLTSISLPVPKFLMHRVAFFGADDFFCNLRKIS